MSVLLAPLLVVAAVVGFAVYCVRDLNRNSAPQSLPRDTWLLLIVFAGPFGGIAYLMLGRPCR